MYISRTDLFLLVVEYLVCACDVVREPLRLDSTDVAYTRLAFHNNER